ncbi:hypothetical protein A5740_10465 [Mycobacterium sp. GA-1841]|nr:hypothetical protein A5740_10465 [Mycobacterium sp. GA-1841]
MITVILIIGITCALIFFVGAWYSKKSEYQKRARLYTFSSAFWARWPGERLWVAPYPELAGEAARCEDILAGMGLTPPHYEHEQSEPVIKAEDAQRGDQRVDRDGASFLAKRGVVLQAMTHAIAQGRGPQSPPGTP